jgi:hypothetical protein
MQAMGWTTADGFSPLDTNTLVLALLAWALLGGWLYLRLSRSRRRIRKQLLAAEGQLDRLRGRDPLTGLITRPELRRVGALLLPGERCWPKPTPWPRRCSNACKRPSPWRA